MMLTLRVTGLEESVRAIKALPERVMGSMEVALTEVAERLTEWAQDEHLWQNRSFDTWDYTRASVGRVTVEEATVLLRSLSKDAGVYETRGAKAYFAKTSGGAGKWIELADRMKQYRWLEFVMQSHLEDILEILADHGVNLTAEIGGVVGVTEGE